MVCLVTKMLVTVGALVAPCALASVPVAQIDGKYFDARDVSASSKMLTVELNRDGLNWVKFPVYSSPQLKNEQRSFCTLTKEFDTHQTAKLSCGLSPALGTFYFESSVDFLIKSETPEAIELATDNHPSLWLSKKDGLNVGAYNTYKYRLQPLGEWVASHMGFVRTVAGGSETKLYKEPAQLAPLIGNCRDGVLLQATNREESRVKDDWLFLECVSSGCASASRCREEALGDPESYDATFNRCYLSQTNKCSEGWLHWRSPNGKLLLLPDPSADVFD